MSRNLYRTILFITWAVIILVFLFLVILSFDAAAEPKALEFLNFDFSRKHNIISAYGGLMGSILSFITILFVIMDLVYQRRLTTVESEKQEENRRKELRDSLGVIPLFINRLYQNNLKQSERAALYAEKESNQPTEMNQMSFSPNTFPKLILEVDRQNIFKALREFKPGVNWQEIYVDLYKICDFYDLSTKELTEKHQIHINKKYVLSMEISNNLDSLIDKVSNARNYLIMNTKNIDELRETPFFIMLDRFKVRMVQVVDERNNKILEGVNPEEISSSMMEFREDIVSPLFNDILQYYNEKGEVPPRLEEILKLSQDFLRQTEKLIKDSKDYAAHIKYYNSEYLEATSRYQKRLMEISEMLQPYVLEKEQMTKKHF